MHVAACGLLAAWWKELNNLPPFSLPAGGNRGIKASTEMTAEEWDKLRWLSQNSYDNLWIPERSGTAVMDECKRKWFVFASKTRSKLVQHLQNVVNLLLCEIV